MFLTENTFLSSLKAFIALFHNLHGNVITVSKILTSLTLVETPMGISKEK